MPFLALLQFIDFHILELDKVISSRNTFFITTCQKKKKKQDIIHYNG